MRVKLDIPISISDVIHTTCARSVYDENKYIYAICTDTRVAEPNDLFIALKGEIGNGECYVDEALTKGCYVLSSATRGDVLEVEDTTDALLSLAKFYKSQINPKYTVAVTGSVGKSTTVKFLSKILGVAHRVHSPTGNFNNHLGVPLTILATDRKSVV